MRILVVGASGTVGQAVVKELSRRHEVIRAGRSSGDVTVDLMNEDSVRAMFAKVGKVGEVPKALIGVRSIESGGVPFHRLERVPFAPGRFTQYA